MGGVAHKAAAARGQTRDPTSEVVNAVLDKRWDAAFW
jgi:hypothetical protein